MLQIDGAVGLHRTVRLRREVPQCGGWVADLAKRDSQDGGLTKRNLHEGEPDSDPGHSVDARAGEGHGGGEVHQPTQANRSGCRVEHRSQRRNIEAHSPRPSPGAVQPWQPKQPLDGCEKALGLLLKRLQRRHIRSFCGRIRGRSLAQRAHKLAMEQRRLRAQRLKLFGVAAENTCDSRRHLIAGRRDDPRSRRRRRPGGRPDRLPDLGQVSGRFGQSLRCCDHIRRHRRVPLHGGATTSRQL